jgi:DNA-binding beta-propeller fold protein YncE
MKRRQFTRLCASSVLLPVAASLVACGGGGAADSGNDVNTAASGQTSPVPALPNERIVVSSAGTAYTLNKDEQSLSPTSGISLSGFALGGWRLGSTPDSHPVDVSFDAAGKAYVLDLSLGEVRVYSTAGTLLATWASYGSGPGQLAKPTAITVVGSKVYVADSGNHRVQVFALDGQPLLQFGALDSAASHLGSSFNFPRDVEVGPQGQMYVLQSGKSRVTVHDAAGNHTSTLDLSRNAQGKRQQVNAIALGPTGELVYTELSTGTVCTLNSQGQIKSQLSAQIHYGKPVAALYIAQGRNAQPLLSGFVNLA